MSLGLTQPPKASSRGEGCPSFIYSNLTLFLAYMGLGFFPIWFYANFLFPLFLKVDARLILYMVLYFKLPVSLEKKCLVSIFETIYIRVWYWERERFEIEERENIIQPNH